MVGDIIMYILQMRNVESRDYISCSVQFSSVAQSCPTLCDPMDCSKPDLPAHHQFPEFTQTHVHWVGDAIQPSHLLSSPFFHLQFFPASGSFPVSQIFASGDQSIGASASTLVLPMNIQVVLLKLCLNLRVLYEFAICDIFSATWIVGSRREFREDWTQRQWVVAW